MRDDCPQTADPSDCLDDDTVACFVERVLGADQRERVERLIDRCATCRRQVSEVIRLRSQLGMLATAPAVAPERLGRYQVRGVLGQGGMGIVLRAWDPQLEREVALKLVRGETADGKQRLMREARAMAKLRHPAVITIYDADELAGEVCVVMELVDGEDLAVWFARRPAWQEVVARCALAGSGLSAAHAAGLIHRDFKPHNVLCARDGRVLVADFGLARSSPGIADATSALTSASALAGTPAYMAPEQLLGEPIGPAADQFAFAATLYEGLYGVRPFGGTTLASLIAEIVAGSPRRPPTDTVPAAIAAVVIRGLARDPGARWPSVQAMIDALVAAAAPAPTRRPRTAAVAVGLAAIATGGVVAVLAMRSVTPTSMHDAGPVLAASTADAVSGRVADARAVGVDAGAAVIEAGVVDAGTTASRDGGAGHHATPEAGLTLSAARFAHFELEDRGAFDAAAHAWAADAQLESMRGTRVRADGTVDLAAGSATYSYRSRARAASDDPELARHCSYEVRIAGGGVTVSHPMRECDAGNELHPPRCTVGKLWAAVERFGGDPSQPAEIAYEAWGSWEFFQGATRHAVADDCPRFAP